LGLTIHLLGIYLIASSIVIIPSCDWDDVAVCTSGKNGQVVNANSTFLTFCMDTFSTNWNANWFWNLGYQYGFITGDTTISECLLYGCTGCMRTTTICGTTSTTVTCEHTRSTGDVDPLSPFVYIGFILFGAILFFTNRDLLPTKRTLFALVIVVAGVYIIEQSIAFKDVCPSSDATASVCGGALPGQVKNDKVINYEYCGQSGYTSFATNVPPAVVPGPNTSSKCLQYGCPSRSCLKMVATCPALDDPAYQCVSPSTLASAQPVNLFIGILFVVVGALVWFLRDKS